MQKLTLILLLAVVISAITSYSNSNNFSDVTETTVSTSSVETSEVSTEESKDVTLSNDDKRRIELFERASTVKRDDGEGAILKKWAMDT